MKLFSARTFIYVTNIFVHVCMYVCAKHKLSLVAARSKAWVCSLLLAGIAGSNPAGGIDVCFSPNKYKDISLTYGM